MKIACFCLFLLLSFLCSFRDPESLTINYYNQDADYASGVQAAGAAYLPGASAGSAARCLTDESIGQFRSSEP